MNIRCVCVCVCTHKYEELAVFTALSATVFGAGLCVCLCMTMYACVRVLVQFVSVCGFCVFCVRVCVSISYSRSSVALLLRRLPNLVQVQNYLCSCDGESMWVCVCVFMCVYADTCLFVCLCVWAQHVFHKLTDFTAASASTFGAGLCV